MLPTPFLQLVERALATRGVLQKVFRFARTVNGV
jgi:hypothetical protein